VVADNGVSGLSTRLTERPERRRLYDKLRAGDTLVVRWVDRLGRNYVSGASRAIDGMAISWNTLTA
jgi:DNA invertase Pin-like site-specific DNA recombinase